MDRCAIANRTPPISVIPVWKLFLMHRGDLIRSMSHPAAQRP
jgi:hypothetical protein